MTNLRTIAYHSHEAQPTDEFALASLLIRAQRFNDQHEVTGLLAYANGVFLQTIEGEADAVGRVYERICKDPQHTDVVTFVDEPIEQRSYPTWAMLSTIDRANKMILGFLQQKIAAPGDRFTSGQVNAMRRLIEFVEHGGRPKWLLAASEA